MCVQQPCSAASAADARDAALRRRCAELLDDPDPEPSINLLTHVPGIKNRGDLGTKPLDSVRHWTLLNRMRVQSLSAIRGLARL